MTQKELLRLFGMKALDHGQIVTRNNIIVKRYYWVLKSLTTPLKWGPKARQYERIVPERESVQTTEAERPSLAPLGTDQRINPFLSI